MEILHNVSDSHRKMILTLTIQSKQDVPQPNPAAQFGPCGLLPFPNPQSRHTAPLDKVKQNTVCYATWFVCFNSQKQNCGSLRTL